MLRIRVIWLIGVHVNIAINISHKTFLFWKLWNLKIPKTDNTYFIRNDRNSRLNPTMERKKKEPNVLAKGVRQKWSLFVKHLFCW